jgi:hypothetical protein
VSDRHLIAAAATLIFETVRALPSPRHAAKALAAAHLMLIEAEAVPDEAGVHARLNGTRDCIVEAWRERHEKTCG